MKMLKMFTTTFDPVLKEMGFKRKGRLYYRLVGEILQGVVLKTINPYSIHFFAQPYWMELDSEKWTSLAKGYWAESGAYKIGTDVYYKQEYEELNQYVMSFCLEVAEKYFLPFLDRIVDFDSLLESINPDWDMANDFPKMSFPVGTIEYPLEVYDIRPPHRQYGVWARLGGLRDKSQYVFLYKAYKDGSFEESEKLLKAYIIDPDIKRHIKLFGTPLSENDNIIKFMTELFYKKMAEGDVNWIEEYRQQRRLYILPRLRDELGLNTFDL